MPSPSKRRATREKVKSYRARMRAKGLRLVQIWVPDTRSPRFLAEARRQGRAVANSALEHEDQASIDAVSDRE
jgi:hypothetical protein